MNRSTSCKTAPIHICMLSCIGMLSCVQHESQVTSAGAPHAQVAPTQSVQSEAKQLSTSDPLASFETTAPEMTPWEKEQTRQAVDSLRHRPHYAEVLRRIRQYRTTSSATQVDLRGKVTFSLQPATAASGMSILRRKPQGDATPLLTFKDADTANRKEIDFMEVSPSGKFIAVGISEAGTEQTTVHVIDGKTGKELSDRSYNVELGRNGRIRWLPDDSGYLYMRERDRKTVSIDARHRDVSVALHNIGEPEGQDREVVGARAPGARIVDDYDFPYPHLSPDGRDIIIAVAHRVNPDLIVFTKRRAALLDGKSEWQRLYEERDGVKAVSADNGRAIAVRTVGDRYILEETSLDASHSRRELYSAKFPIEDVIVAGKTVYFVETEIATKYLVRLQDGNPVRIAFPEGTSIRTEDLRVDPQTKSIVANVRSWTEPPSWWTVSEDKRNAEPLAGSARPLKTDLYEVRVLEAPARDGERIPITVVRAKSQGNTPPKFVWVSAYGCYGIVPGPNFTVPRRTFLDYGGTYVYAHIRGGGEKGEKWHRQARGITKIKSVEDLIDSVKYLRAEGFGTGGGMLVSGGSAGGIPVGGLLVRAPELVDGVFVEVGTLNVSRSEATSATGPLHREEYGSSDTPEGARALREIDAYLNIRDGQRYPTTLLRTGVNDARVPRWYSSKFAARLQKATAAANPILLRLTGGGHAIGGTPDEEAETDAELVTFILSSVKHPSAN